VGRRSLERVSGEGLHHGRRAAQKPAGQRAERFFDELLERIRDIRSSERRFYQKVLDIYATSVDYTPDADASQKFFATVQNKMHWATHGHTAAEVIAQRADATQPLMGMTSTRPGGIILDAGFARNRIVLLTPRREVGGSAWHRRGKHNQGTDVPRSPRDVSLRILRFRCSKIFSAIQESNCLLCKVDLAIAKNYLTEDELQVLNRIVNLYIEYAELQALERKPMTMHDWIVKLDEFLKISGRQLLDNAGKISAEHARAKAEQEYARYRAVLDAAPRAVDADFDKVVKELKKLPKPRKPKGGQP